MLVRAAGAGGRVPGKAQVKKVLSRIEKGDKTFGEEFAGGASRSTRARVRFVPARQKSRTRGLRSEATMKLAIESSAAPPF